MSAATQVTMMDGMDRSRSLSADASLDPLFERFVKEASQRNGGKTVSLRDWSEVAEKWFILHALRQCRGNRSAAARNLGIGRRTLYSKLDKLGIASVWRARRI